MSRAAIRLFPADTIAVCCRTVEAGEVIVLDGTVITAAHGVAIGHKIALVAMTPGDKVIKYGMPIGSMTRPVQPGEWVHMHNMQSDYMPAHLRDATGDRA